MDHAYCAWARIMEYCQTCPIVAYDIPHAHIPACAWVYGYQEQLYFSFVSTTSMHYLFPGAPIYMLRAILIFVHCSAVTSVQGIKIIKLIQNYSSKVSADCTYIDRISVYIRVTAVDA